MSILIVSGSLRPVSHSRSMTRAAEQVLKSEGAAVEWADLRDYPMPLCDGDAAYEHPSVEKLSVIIQRAKVILVGIPVYNFDVNAAVKNMLELTGDAWEDKAVGFLCAAGGRSSYMAAMNFGNDLMLDFRCLIIPRFVYATRSDFTSGPDGQSQISSEEVKDRIRQLALESVRFSKFV